MWPWRSMAEPLLDRLKEVGIFHDNAKAAAEFVNNQLVDEKLGCWWSSLAVQQARKEYCEQYANSSDDEYKQWSQQILKWLEGIH